MKVKKIGNIKYVQKALEDAKEAYKYQENLTSHLDKNDLLINDYSLLQIVLWKVNRYPEFLPETIPLLGELKSKYSQKLARKALKCLLQAKGVDLPMASTILRFIRPDKFQIIDQRVYRLIMPGKSQLKLPRQVDEKIDLYFKYLSVLRQVCKDHRIPFKMSDRWLYQIDKTINKSIKIKS